MKKRSVKIIVAIFILLLLMIVYFVLRNIDSKEENSDTQETEEVLSISSDDVEKISFKLDNQKVTFEKKDDGWIDTQDENFPVDKDKIESILQGLESVSAVRELDDLDELEEYGLDKPEQEITVTTKDRKVTIQVGDVNETVQGYYSILDGDDTKVYLIDASFVTQFEGELYDFAEAGTFPVISADDIDEIQVNKPEDSYSLVKSSDVSSGWLVKVGDSEEEADSTAASQASTAVNSLSYLNFVDYHCEDYSKYGLDQPEYQILIQYHQTVESSDSTDEEESEDESVTENKEVTLKVGDKTGENYYVCVDDSQEIYTMSGDTLATLIDETASSYWNLKVNYVAITDIQSLMVEYGGEKSELTVERDTDDEGNEEEKYFIDGKKADENSFKNFYNSVTGISAKERMEENYTPQSDPEWKLQFTWSDGQESVAYYSYNENFYVAVKENGTSYLINKMDVKNLEDLLSTLKSGEEE